MKNNSYQKLTNEELLKKRNLFKGVTTGFGILMLLVIATLSYLIGLNGFKNTSIAVFIPMIILPFTFMPLAISYSLLQKEIKSRNL